MRDHGWRWGYACGLVVIAILTGMPVGRAMAEGPFLVGRIAHVEGQLLRFVPDEQDWVATVKDTPFGLEDALYSDEGSEAELILPNGTWIRIGGSTQIQMIALSSEVSELDVASGVTRFYNRSRQAWIRASTPFGYVVAPPGSAFDLYVGDQSAEVIALNGSVDFIDSGDEARYQVTAGSSALLAGGAEVGAVAAVVDADWDDWNKERDDLWNDRLDTLGESARHLPPELFDEAYELDANGGWETVRYEGEELRLWRPIRVGGGWAPFTAGRWTEYYGDHTWIPAEPSGYVTHHYGNWIYVNQTWYWMPPAAGGGGLGWYPGRVVWIGAGAEVGWVPLAPKEPYYCHRAWGPAAIPLGTGPAVNLTIGNLAYVDHAVVVPSKYFYSVRDYGGFKDASVSRTAMVNQFQPAPVMSQAILKNYDSDRNRFRVTTAAVERKPHQSVLVRIERNQSRAARDQQEAVNVNASALQQRVAQTRAAAIPTNSKLPPPKVANRLVPAAQTNKPVSEVQFQPRDLKQRSRPAQALPAAVTTRPEPRPAPPAAMGARPGSKQPPGLGTISPSGSEPATGTLGQAAETRQSVQPGGHAVTRPGGVQGPLGQPRVGEQPLPGATRQPADPGPPPGPPREPIQKPRESSPKPAIVAPRPADHPGTGALPEPKARPRVAPDPGRSEPQPVHRTPQHPGGQPRDQQPSVQQPAPRPAGPAPTSRPGLPQAPVTQAPAQ